MNENDIKLHDAAEETDAPRDRRHPRMTEIDDENRRTQRALLIALDTGEYDSDVSLQELSALAESAGAEVVGTLTQRRPTPDAATCVGAGFLREAALYVQNLQAELVVFDLELTGSQHANIERVLDCRVIDRTALILDIFAQRAHTAEGRLQVELAQQQYRLPRLIGTGTELSRLGGGIGTRGPGETKLEADRRHVRRRIRALEQELESVRRRRALQHDRRKKDGVTTVAIVGYTNVGKSTLLNDLTNAGVLAENKLFATLDPTARALTLPNGRQVLLVDTVGLVRRLPHTLVDAFRSTLEEAANADLILNVCDVSSPDAAEQCRVTEELLKELGAENIPVLTVLNQCDRLPPPLPDEAGDVCLISAKTGFGVQSLLEKIAARLPQTQRRMRLLLPYSQGALLGEIRASGKVLSEEFMPDGTLVDALVERHLIEKCAPYVKGE